VIKQRGHHAALERARAAHAATPERLLGQ